MKKTGLFVTVAVIALGFVGCSTKSPPLNLQQKYVSENYSKDGLYYRVGGHARTSACGVGWNKISDGLLKCTPFTVNDNGTPYFEIVQYSDNISDQYLKLKKNYESILSNEEYKKKNFIIGNFPKSNSKEFKKLKKFIIKAIRDRDINSVSPMNQQEVQAYLQQKKLNNNPNVIAARLQYAAAQEASHKTITINKNVNHSGYVNSYNTNTNYNYGY